MHSICFNIGRLPIYWYGVMMALGFFCGLASWTVLGRREGRNFNFCADLLFWIMVSGIIGARLVYVVSDFRYFLVKPLMILRVDQGGLIYYGGFIGATLAIFVFAKIRSEKLLPLSDFTITSVPLAHAFGRIGCFLNGCCHGKEYDDLFAVSYPSDSFAWWLQTHMGKINRFEPRSLPVHPVQLYEAAFNVVLYLFLIWAYRRRRQDGGIIALYLLTYSFARFWFEFLRGDERMKWMGLSVAQLISAFLFLVGVGLLVTSRRSQVKNQEVR